MYEVIIHFNETFITNKILPKTAFWANLIIYYKNNSSRLTDLNNPLTISTCTCFIVFSSPGAIIFSNVADSALINSLPTYKNKLIHINTAWNLFDARQRWTRLTWLKTLSPLNKLLKWNLPLSMLTRFCNLASFNDDDVLSDPNCMRRFMWRPAT